MIDVKRLAKALAKIGYPPVWEQRRGSPGPSAHYEHDYEAYAVAIAREYAQTPDQHPDDPPEHPDDDRMRDEVRD